MNINIKQRVLIHNVYRAVLIISSILILFPACRKTQPYTKEPEREKFFFAKGVSAEKGWHDTEKLQKPEEITKIGRASCRERV